MLRVLSFAKSTQSSWAQALSGIFA